MTNAYEIRHVDFSGQEVLIPTGPYSPEIYKAIVDNNILYLRLSDFMGWSGSDLGFLKELPFLQGVQIISHQIEDLTPLDELEDIHSLMLDGDFKKFPSFDNCKNLSSFLADWVEPYRFILELSGLKYVNIQKYPDADFSSLSKNKNLNMLFMRSHRLKSVNGISGFKKLDWVDIDRSPNLTDFSDFSSVRSARIIELECCKGLQSLDCFREMKNLERLNFDGVGEIESLHPLKGCDNLRKVSFCGNTTIVDGDLSPLLALPRMEGAYFNNRRHYSMKGAVLRAMLEERLAR